MASSSLFNSSIFSCKSHKNHWLIIIDKVEKKDASCSIQINVQFIDERSRQFFQNGSIWCLYHKIRNIVDHVFVDAKIRHLTISTNKRSFSQKDSITFRDFKRMFATKLHFTRKPIRITIKLTGSKSYCHEFENMEN